MNAVDESAIRKIEMQLSRQLVEDFGIDVRCLCFDCTNFDTFIDSRTTSELARRGHAKSKRTDLRVVGLALLVSTDFNIPLFSRVYPGNQPDSAPSEASPRNSSSATACWPRISSTSLWFSTRATILRRIWSLGSLSLPRGRLVSSYPTSGSSGGSARQVPIVPGCPPGGSDRLPHFQEGFWASLDHRGHPQPGIARGTTPRHRASAREASPGFRRTAGETQAEPRARGQGEGLHLREPGSPRPESFLRPIHPEDPAGRNRAAARKAPVALPHRCAGLGEAHRHLLGKKNSVHRQPPVDDRGDHSGVPQSASCGGCLPHHEGSPLRGLGASLSLDRSKNPCPCFLLRAGPDSGWAVAPRSPPRRPGAQSRRPLSGTLFDLRNHQSLSLDFEEEDGPSSRLHHVH